MRGYVFYSKRKQYYACNYRKVNVKRAGKNIKKKYVFETILGSKNAAIYCR